MARFNFGLSFFKHNEFLDQLRDWQRVEKDSATCISLGYIKEYKNIRIRVYRTIIFPVLCGCETWSLTLKEEHKLRVLKDRVLRKIFGPKGEEVTG
jgi:hypothetical protein